MLLFNSAGVFQRTCQQCSKQLCPNANAYEKQAGPVERYQDEAQCLGQFSTACPDEMIPP